MSVTPKRQRLLLDLLAQMFGEQVRRGNPQVVRQVKRGDRLIVTLKTDGRQTTYELRGQR